MSVMGTTLTTGCKHNIDMGMEYPCMACDPTPDDPRLHSIGVTWPAGGKANWHDGPTIREAQAEIFANAKRYGIEPERVR